MRRRGRWARASCLCRRLLRLFFRFGRCFCLGLGFGSAQNFLANFFRDVGRNGARMRLFFRYAIPGQKVNDGLGFDLEFAGQLVDSNLICVAHALRSDYDFASSACPSSPSLPGRAASAAGSSVGGVSSATSLVPEASFVS